MYPTLTAGALKMRCVVGQTPHFAHRVQYAARKRMDDRRYAVAGRCGAWEWAVSGRRAVRAVRLLRARVQSAVKP